MSSSSSADPSSSPIHSAGNSSTKHAWSQIVAASASKKLPQIANQEQIPTIAKEPVTNQVRGQTQANAELGITPLESTLDDDRAGAEDARVSDEASLKGDEAAEAFKNIIDSNAVAADGTEASQNKHQESGSGDVTDPKVARPPWRKPPMLTEGDIKVQPVMGATAWPALAEARNMKKTPEMRKLKESFPKSLQSGASIQEPLSKASLQSGDGLNHQQGVKHKPSFKGSVGGIGRPAFQPIENGASFLQHPALGAHGGSEQSIKHNPHARMKGNFAANPMDNDRVHHHRNDGGGPFPNNNRKWRNNHRDQGRGWNHHGRAYENAGDMVTLLHEQRIGPRNMPRPQPFINMNAGFYPIPHFQNGMYYIPPGAPEFVHGPPYFPPMAPPVGPDPLVLRSMLLKQVEYYFSVENLCRDVFLRMHMDDEGFVAVSLIAQFNRIRSLSANPMVILEALQQSAVVEVQHDRIRRRNDRGKWRLVRDQVYAVNSTQENMSLGNLSEEAHREPERGADGRLVVMEEKVNNGLEKASEGAHREPERGGHGGSVVASEEVNIGLAEACNMPLEDAEHAGSPSDRLKESVSGDCVGLEDKSEQQVVDDIDSSKDQHSNLLSADACGSTQSSLSRDGSTEEAAFNSLFVSDAAVCQSFDSTSLRDGPDCTRRSLVEFNQESCSRDGSFLEESSMAPQAAADGTSESWKAPEGFWMENSAYLMHGCFEQDGAQTTESDFMLKIHEDKDEHHGEAKDRELDRLINVSRPPLGSFIAVP